MTKSEIKMFDDLTKDIDMRNEKSVLEFVSMLSKMYAAAILALYTTYESKDIIMGIHNGTTDIITEMLNELEENDELRKSILGNIT